MTAVNENMTVSGSDAGIASIASAVFAPLVRVAERRRTAATFNAMSDKMLADMGVDRGDIAISVETAFPGQTVADYIASVRDAVRAAALAWATDEAVHDLNPHLRRDIGMENENGSTVADLISAYQRRVQGALVDPLVDNLTIANDIARRAA